MPTPQRDDVATRSLLTRLDRFSLLPEARALRDRARELLRADPGDAVVDVGCGGGRATGELAAAGTRAVGVDLDPVMLDAARAAHPGAEFRHGDAYRLPLSDGSMRGYRAEKVYHSLDDPLRALAEARRVLAPGGRVVLLGQDWDAYMVDSDDPDTTRRIIAAYADTMADPRAPRRQRALLASAGFTDIETEGRIVVFTDAEVLGMLIGFADAAERSGTIDGARARSWATEQRERAEEGRLFVAVPFLLVSAERP
ncbi:methyltransferase domain-containing protein [Nocardiopsis sp. N85]|uniref:methyltransferase domain-containing protein n=1 Tax=Nocardiopsis sp. N85 TaxID=3029400 RepID=UPI00237FBD26|nr:methyltransferase domain-containing protein [Nocardiopsis sp. N85]MDE3724966.1 methyltransferase domain-containing protein [Nocardiopsis sp. N85]